MIFNDGLTHISPCLSTSFKMEFKGFKMLSKSAGSSEYWKVHVSQTGSQGPVAESLQVFKRPGWSWYVAQLKVVPYMYNMRQMINDPFIIYNWLLDENNPTTEI